jgi:hypothetical protein
VIPLRSSSCLSPDPVTSEPFPSAFTTVAFGQSRRRWFGACSCKPTPRGLPSSVKQLRTSSAFRLFAVLVAHCSRFIVEVIYLRVNPQRAHWISDLKGSSVSDYPVHYGGVTKATPFQSRTHRRRKMVQGRDYTTLQCVGKGKNPLARRSAREDMVDGKIG